MRWIFIIALGVISPCLMPAATSSCQRGACAAEAPDIVWAHEIRSLSLPPNRLVIAGTKKDGTFLPGYVILPEAEERGEAALFPRLTNLVPLFAAKTFGAEERARLSTADRTSLALRCRPGVRPAGLVLSAPEFHYPKGLDGELVIKGRANGNFAISLIDAGRDAPDETGDKKLPKGVLARFPASAWEQGNPAKQLVVACPRGEASVHIEAIEIIPRPGQVANGIGSWLWDMTPWLGQPDRLVALAKSRDVTKLFVQIRIEQGEIADRSRVLALIGKLASAGIAVHAVEGDPQMASPAGRAVALARAEALRGFIAVSGGTLKSVQYDIEPYLLPQFDSDPTRWWGEWAISVNGLSQRLGKKIQVAVPLWMLGRADGRSALEKALDSISDIVVMAYRTDGPELEAIAGGWLDWGSRRGIRIGIALENGPLPVEYHRSYELAERGEVLLERSGATDKVVLASAVTAGTSTRPAYSFTKETEVDPGRISFMNDRVKLNEVLRGLGPNLSAWTSFGGLLVHEIMIP